MFGENMNSSRLIKLIIDSYINEKKLIINNPNSIRDYLYVDDFCIVLINILKNYKKFDDEILNISSHNWIKNHLLIDKLNKLFGKSKNIILKKNKQKEKMNSLFNDGNKVKKKLKNIRFTNFEKAIINTFDFYGIKKL